MLGAAQADAALFAEPRRKRGCGGCEFGIRHHSVDEADLLCVLGAEEIAGEHQMLGAQQADRAGEPLRPAGAGQLSVASRDPARAAEVAAAVHGRPLPTSDIPAALAGADLLVTATGATVPILLLAQVEAARAQAAGRPLYVLDLGLPPDVDPAIGRLAGVTLTDLTALGQHLADGAVPGQVPQVRAIVAAEAAGYIEREQQAAATPVIAAMHAQIRQLADAELTRLQGRLPGLSDQERAETAATVHRILRKVLHQPTVRAREFSSGPDGRVYLDALRQLFNLPEEARS